MKAANLPRCLLHVPPHPSSVRCLLGSSQDPGYLMTLWGCLCNWLPQAPWMSGQACEAWCRAGPPPHCFVRCWWPSPSCRTPGIYAAQPLWLWLRWEQAVQAFPPRRLPCCLCSFMMGLYFQQRCGCLSCLFWTICPSFQSRR